MLQEVRESLHNNADPKYKEFHQSLVPGLDSMIGVRVPKVREIARKAAKSNWQEEWEQLSDQCYEELLIKGMLIGYGKLSQAQQAEYLRKFVPSINNWAICDCCQSTWKFMKKDREFWFSFLQPYFYSDQEFEVRFAVVAVLDHFVEKEYLDRIFTLFSEIHQEGYYVNMAVAWALSVYYVKFPEETWNYLCENQLNDFTHNKAIQKIRESYRVSKEDKEKLLTLKR